MNNSFPRLIDGMCATLRTEVLPRLTDEFARGQVFGVINLLNTFKVRADWSAGFLAQQVAAQCRALDRAAALLRAQPVAGSMPTLPPREPSAPVSAADLLEMRDEGNRAIGALLGWLADAQGGMPPGLAAQVERELRDAMLAEIDIELKHSPRPMFARPPACARWRRCWSTPAGRCRGAQFRSS